MAWIAAEVFDEPTWLNEPAIIERIGPTVGGLRALQTRQAGVLDRLLDERRMDILSEMEATQPGAAYPLQEFLDDVRNAIWNELDDAPAINGYRRALQRAWVERMQELMTEQPEGNPFQGAAPNLARSDTRPLIRAQLVALLDDIESADRRISHRATSAHLADLAARIRAILEDDAG
jgi:hypothetical protein